MYKVIRPEVVCGANKAEKRHFITNGDIMKSGRHGYM